MNILFCESPLEGQKVDEAFYNEYNSAKENGFNTFLYNYETGCVSGIQAAGTTETVIYRGWMLKIAQYKKLYEIVWSKNYKLINNPVEYQNCHYLPDSLRFIGDYTPKTIYQKIENDDSINILLDKAKIFDGNPVIIKDYVKSEKHYWHTACFVENAGNHEKLREAINNFITIRENALNEGIVIREYVELCNLAKHSKSGMPLSEEYRLFFCNRQLLSFCPYWEEGVPVAEKPDVSQFRAIAQAIDSNFFTMDIARTRSGQYIIIELGDGQVAGIPEGEDRHMFYNKLKGIITA